MREPAYPAPQAVAATIQEYFSRHIEVAHQHGQPPGNVVLPDASTIEAIIDAAFWASLQREENYFPKISLAFLPPEQAGQPLIFERRLPLIPVALSRLAPAVERPGIHLGVWHYDNKLSVWGTTREVPVHSFIMEVVEPGLLVVKYRRDQDSGKFVNVAVLKGNEIKVIDEEGARLPDCPEMVSSLLGFSSPADKVNILVQLAISMRAHGRGGTLLVVPQNSERWRDSIVQPISYLMSPPFNEMADLMRQAVAERDRRSWQDALHRSVNIIAGLTAVDGAALLSDQYELLAFGVKIGRREGGAQVEHVVMTEPVVGSATQIVNPVQLGGTRHLSAAQFIQDQRDAVALVASQDGRFTIFAWSPCENMVHAHRVETLLL